MAYKSKKKKNKNKNESKKLDSFPPNQDPIVKMDTEKLFEMVKAKVEAIKAAKTTNALDIPFHDVSASTPEKAYPVEKKIENGERDYLCDLPNVSQRAEPTTDAGPLLVLNRVQKLIDIKNDNITVVKQKMKRKKKKSTTYIKIQTLRKQLDNISSIVRCCPTCFDPVKESLLQVLPQYEVPEPVSNIGSNPKIIKCENDNITDLKPKKKKMKKKTTNIKIQTLLKQSDNTSPIVGCHPASFVPVKESLVQELPECEGLCQFESRESLLQVLPQYEVPEPVSNIGSNPKIIKCENDNITDLKPKKKKMKKKTTNIKIQTLLKQSDNTSPIVGCHPASVVPVKESLVQELPECEGLCQFESSESLLQVLPQYEVPEPVSNIGSNPKIIKCENDNITDLKPKKKKMKKKTTNIKIQTLLKQSDNTSPIVGCHPASFVPVKESLVQELPECEGLCQFESRESLLQVLPQYEVPEPVSNIGSNPKIIKCENDNITDLKPKKKKMKKKTTNIKIQTLLKQSDNTSPIVGCHPASVVPVKESLVQELPECEGLCQFESSESLLQVLPQYEVPEPVSNIGSNPKIIKCENDNITDLKPKKKKMKKKTTNIKIQTLLKQSDNTSPIVGCHPASVVPVKESLVQELPECEGLCQFESSESLLQVLPQYEVPEPVSNIGSNPKIIKCENDNITDLKPKKKKMKKKKKKKTTNIKIQTLLKQSDNTSPIVGCHPASFVPVKESLVQELPECEGLCQFESSESLLQVLPQYEVPEPVSNIGSNPKIIKCENDNITDLKPKKKKMKKKKKKKTTNIKIQTLLKQSDNTSPIVGCHPASFVPVKESLVQELPECEGLCQFESSESLLQVLPQYEVPEPVSNIGSNPKIIKCENDNITDLKPKKKKMKKKKRKKTTNIKIQTLLKQSDNTSPIVGCHPASFVPVKESLVQELPECENIKLESLPKEQDPISKKDLKKSLEEVKDNSEALKATRNANAQNIPFYDMSTSTPDKAYPLEKIIEKDEWDCLGDLLNFPEGAKLTPEAYPIFVCNRVQKLEEMKDEYEKRTVASVLQYITHLINYKDTHSWDGHKSVKDHRFPSILEEKFRTMFNESRSKWLSCRERKLLINNVLVLTLFVDGYQSDASDITKDLKMDVAEVKKQYKRLGCEIVHEKPVLLVTLPVPLKSPVLGTSKNL